MQRVKPGEVKVRDPIPIARKGEVPTATTSKPTHALHNQPQPATEQSLCCCCFDRNSKTINRKFCKKCIGLISYFIGFALFLGTFFFLILYSSVKVITFYQVTLLVNKTELRSFALRGIGLTAIPESNDVPVIYYNMNNESQYELYVHKIENMLNVDGSLSRDKDALGPCGIRPYGYGSRPCVYIKINKQRGWWADPLEENSTEAKEAPDHIKGMMNFTPKKLLLYCEGSEPWLNDHLGQIKYYPHPPGYDPKKFPIKMDIPTPIVAMQFSDFTTGLSLTVACKLWYKGGMSRVEFVLYILK